MAVYTAPTTRTTGALISASIWNTDVVENIKYFKDAPVFAGDISVGDDLLFTSSGAVINFDSGDVTITHSTNTLTFAGAASGYIFNDGNVGLGVTPNANWATYRALQLGEQGVVAGYASGAGVLHVGTNFYWDGSAYRYLASDFATQYQQNAGEHYFRTAPSGTAGNSITFTTRLAILNGGNVAIGATARFYFDGVAGTGDTYIYESSANVLEFVTGGSYRAQINSNGVVIATYPTTASAANLWGGNGSNIHISTSSLRYKHDIATLDTDEALNAVMHLRPVTYRGKTDEDQRRFVGFIAEEVQAWAPLLCTYDDGGESGTPNYVTYDRVTAYLVAVVQQQQAEINALKARIH